MFLNLNSVKIGSAQRRQLLSTAIKNDMGEWTTDINSNVDFLDAMMGGMQHSNQVCSGRTGGAVAPVYRLSDRPS